MRKCKVLLQKTLLMLFLLTTSTYAFAQGQVNKRVTVNLTSASIYDFFDVVKHNGSLKFEITAKRLYAASQRVL